MLPCSPDLDLVLGGLGLSLEQRGRAHQHPRRAVAALERVVLGERPLQRGQLAVSPARPSTVARTRRPPGRRAPRSSSRRRRRAGRCRRRSSRCRSRRACPSGRGRRAGSARAAGGRHLASRTSSPFTSRSRTGSSSAWPPRSPLRSLGCLEDGAHDRDLGEAAPIVGGGVDVGRAGRASPRAPRPPPARTPRPVAAREPLLDRRRAHGHRRDAADRDPPRAVGRPSRRR